MRRARTTVGLIVALAALAVTATPALAIGFESKPNQKTKDTTFKEYGKKTGEPSEQTFVIGPIKYLNAKKEPESLKWKITCANAKGTGTAPPESAPSEELTVEVRYQKCTYTGSYVEKVNGRAPTAHFLGQKESPPTFTYNVDGEVKLDNSIEIELTIKALKCLVTIPEQEIEPFETYVPVRYSNPPVEIGTKKTEKEEFPSGFRDRLIIENNIVVHVANEEKEKVGLEYEVAPMENHKTEKPLPGACNNIPESEEIEKVKIEPRHGVNGSYTNSNLKLELPGGELKVTI